MSGEPDTYTSYPCHSRRQSFATMAAKRKKTSVFIPCHYGGEEKGDTVSSTERPLDGSAIEGRILAADLMATCSPPKDLISHKYVHS